MIPSTMLRVSLPKSFHAFLIEHLLGTHVGHSAEVSVALRVQHDIVLVIYYHLTIFRWSEILMTSVDRRHVMLENIICTIIASRLHLIEAGTVLVPVLYEAVPRLQVAL